MGNSIITSIPDGPFTARTGRTREHQLFHSKEDQAHIMTGMVTPGWGVLRKGMVMSVNKSAAGNKGLLVPHVVDDYTDMTNTLLNKGRIFLLEDTADAGDSVKVSLEDSYKLVVGDDLIISDDTTTEENLGAITAITRYAGWAVVEFTDAIGGTAFTTARYANVYVEAGSATPWSDPLCILTRDIDTGLNGVITSERMAPCLVGNAVLYETNVYNYNSDTLDSLSARKAGMNDNFIYVS